MKSVILFIIGAIFIFGGYSIYPKAPSVGTPVVQQPDFTIAGINKKTIAISLFVIAGLLIIWGLFSIKWSSI